MYNNRTYISTQVVTSKQEQVPDACNVVITLTSVSFTSFRRLIQANREESLDSVGFKTDDMFSYRRWLEACLLARGYKPHALAPLT